MKFLVFSRRLIEQVKPYERPHIIISVRTPGDPEEAKLPVGPFTLVSLRLGFHEEYEDWPEERHQYHARMGNAFTVETGRYLLDFVRRYAADTEAVLVHCDAGLARSPAIAHALSQTIFRGQEHEFLGLMATVHCDNQDIYEHLTEKDMTHGGRLPTCFKYILEAFELSRDQLRAELDVYSDLLGAIMGHLPEVDGEDEVGTTVAKAIVRVSTHSCEK